MSLCKRKIEIIMSYPPKSSKRIRAFKCANWLCEFRKCEFEVETFATRWAPNSYKGYNPTCRGEQNPATHLFSAAKIGLYMVIYIYIPGSAFPTIFLMFGQKTPFQEVQLETAFFSETPKNVILMLVAATWLINTLPSLAFSTSFL